MTEEFVRIEEKIRALADAQLDSGHPYLLSKLGTDIGPDLQIIKQSGKTLAEFIKEVFSDCYDIILTGEYRNIQSIIPKNSEIDDSDGSEPVRHPKKADRFNYRFWAAFSVPSSEKKRFLNLEDFTFVDADMQPSNSYELIEPQYIASESVKDEDRDGIILRNIHRWIEEKGFKADQFLAKQQHNGGKGFSHSALSNRTMLHAFISSLDKKQLASVNLPLDVVAALLNRKI